MPADNDAPRSNGTRRVLVAATVVAAAAAIALILATDGVAGVIGWGVLDAGQGEFLLFALTPPRLATDRERAQEIADVTAARLRPLGLDGLILYDIDDEAERNPGERPFPFMPTLDPADYRARHLDTWPTPPHVPHELW